MKINGNLTFNADGSGVIQNAFIEQFASNPTGVTGRIYYNTTSEAYFYFNGSAWVQFAAGSSTVASFSSGTTGLLANGVANAPETGAITLSGTLNATSGGTGSSSAPTPGEFLYSSGGTTYAPTLLTDFATTTFSTGTTGLLANGVNTPVTGAVTLSGTLAATNGGTGQSTYAVGDILYASSTTALSRLAIGTATQVLHGGTTPSYSAVVLTTDVSGTLPVGNGGTGATSFTTNGVVLGGTTLTSTAVGASGTVLTGTGSAPVFTALNTIAVTSVTGTPNEITASPTVGAVVLSIPSTFIAPGTVTVTSDLTVDGLTYESAATNIAAAGTNQATATQLTKSYNVVTTSTPVTADGVELPASGVGLEITVVNFSTNAINVYPTGTNVIDGGVASAPVVIPAGATATYQSVNSGNWYTIDPAIVTSGAGLSVLYSPGETVLSNTGVTSFTTSLTGITASPSTGAVSLTGTLGVASGGTGDTTLTLNGVLFGNGTSPVSVTAAGTQYQVLQANGSGVPVFGAVNLAQSAAVTGVLALTNGGTGASLTGIPGAPIYSDTTTTFAVGTAGTAGQAYISGGASTPTWQTVSSNLTTNPGAILEGDGSGAFVANGAAFAGSGSFSGVTLNGTVTNATDATTKAYVDAAVTGLTWKTAVQAATTAPQVLATDFAAGNVIDGYTLVLGNRILIKNQSSGVENGIYIITALVPTRATDMASGSNADNDAMFVEHGTVNGNTAWVETASPAVVGTNALVFTQFAGSATYTAGSGLTLVGTQFNVKPDNVTIYIDGSNKVAVDSSATAGQVLTSTGTTGTTATWSAVALGNTNAVSGQLTVPNGGTGATTFTAHGVLIGEGTSAVNSTSAGTSGQVLTSNGSSADPTFQTLSTLAVTSITGTANEIAANGVFTAQTGAVTLTIPSTFIVPGSLEVTTTSKFDGLTYESAGALTATAGNPAITAAFTVVTTTGAGQGVTLPVPAYAGVEISIVNPGANSISVYPNTGGAIDGAGTNNPIVVPAGGTWTGQASTTTQWYSLDPVVVNGTGITVTYSNGQTSISNTGVLSFSAGSTGFTPSSPAAGNIVLTGTLNLASGGTNASLTATAGGIVYSTASAMAISAAGSTGNFLVSGGTGAPTWLANATPIDTDGAGTTTLVVGSSFDFFGTANQIVTAVDNTPHNGVQFSISPTFVAPGSITATTSLTVSGLTANSFLYSGTAGLLTTTTAPTDGQLLIGSNGVAPVAATLTGGTGITITNGAGTITVASNTNEFVYDSTLHGGAAEYFAVTHGLSQKYVTVQVYTQDTSYVMTGAVTTGPGGSFQVTGDFTSVYTPGTYFIVAGSGGNNTFYTVASVSYSSPFTTIVVTGTVANGTTSGSLLVGPSQIIPQGIFLVDANNLVVTLNAPLNVFIVVMGSTGVSPA